MDVPALLNAPDPVDVSIITSVPRAEVIDRLEQAFDEQPYSKPGRFSAGFFRFGGSVTGAGIVTLTAKPYVLPGLVAGYGAMTIEFRGDVRPAENGSQVIGIVTAPVSRTIPAFLTILLIGWGVFGIKDNGSAWPNWIFMVLGGFLLAAAGTWVIRRNQRMALRNVSELTLLVETIIGGPSEPTRDGYAPPATG